ncbi:MAG: hypothetical protein E4G89_05925 [Methanothrix sp.]|nr:MAG: hypothetical protein E4G89_05925 [Methanothrix sp.]
MLNNLKGIDLVLYRLDNEIAVVKDSMSKGNLAGYAEYKEACGVVTGLLKARREIVDVFKVYDEDEDGDY